MKKRVGILYSGSIRSNGLNPDYKADNIILESTEKYFLNDEFKNKYEYDIFISTDKIDIQKAKDFYGENLKNIHLLENNFYLNPIHQDIPSYNFLLETYLKKHFDPHPSFQSNIEQYYRMYCAFQMLLFYQKENNVHYDYLVKIRPDLRIMMNLMDWFDVLEKTNKQIIMEHEQTCILKYELKDIFRLVEHYGDYTEHINTKIDIYRFLSKLPASTFSNEYMLFCAEKQFVDHVYYTIKNKNMDFNSSFVGIPYPSYNLLYRENGLYGHIPVSHPIYFKKDYIWEPFCNIDSTPYK